MLRGGVAAGTARKLLRKRAKSVNTFDLQIALVGHPDAYAAAHGRPGRVVGFLRAVDGARLGVVALLAEVAAPHERLARERQVVLQPERDVAEVDGRVVVDEPALRRRDDGVAVGVERRLTSSDARTPAPDVARREKSNFGVLRVPYCDRSSSVRRAGGVVTTLMTPPIA